MHQLFAHCLSHKVEVYIEHFQQNPWNPNNCMYTVNTKWSLVDLCISYDRYQTKSGLHRHSGRMSWTAKNATMAPTIASFPRKPCDKLRLYPDAWAGLLVKRHDCFGKTLDNSCTRKKRSMSWVILWWGDMRQAWKSGQLWKTEQSYQNKDQEVRAPHLARTQLHSTKSSTLTLFLKTEKHFVSFIFFH